MVSHQGFCVLGYVYAILGILGSFLLVFRNYFSVGEGTEYEASLRFCAPAASFLNVVFFIILLVGIQQKHLTLVKIYRIFLKITYVIVLSVIAITIVILIRKKLHSEEQSDMSEIMVILLLISAIMVTGLYLLFLWIVNGVIVAIQSQQYRSRSALYHPAYEEAKPCSEPA